MAAEGRSLIWRWLDGRSHKRQSLPSRVRAYRIAFQS
jgi:hypothetical protein